MFFWLQWRCSLPKSCAIWQWVISNKLLLKVMTPWPTLYTCTCADYYKSKMYYFPGFMQWWNMYVVDLIFVIWHHLKLLTMDFSWTTVIQVDHTVILLFFHLLQSLMIMLHTKHRNISVIMRTHFMTWNVILMDTGWNSPAPRSTKSIYLSSCIAVWLCNDMLL